MSISGFFTETLGANLANSRWSWGATNPIANEVFLRVWADEISRSDGVDRSLLLNTEWEGASAGFPERARHVQAIREGATGYGVVCTVKDTDAAKRKIKSFDRDWLLRFDAIQDIGPSAYGVIAERVPVAARARARSAASTLVTEVRGLLARREIEQTHREALINARVGQGRFRAELLEKWGRRCCVTGVTALDAVRASHIKPWRDATDDERLDPDNGLPLVATLDALFDVGLIGFDGEDRMLVSPRLSDEDCERMGLLGQRLIAPPGDATQTYLRQHRDTVFLAE